MVAVKKHLWAEILSRRRTVARGTFNSGLWSGRQSLGESASVSLRSDTFSSLTRTGSTYRNTIVRNASTRMNDSSRVLEAGTAAVQLVTLITHGELSRFGLRGDA